MSKLAEIQKAIVALPPTKRDELRDWLLTQGGVLDPEQDTQAAQTAQCKNGGWGK